MQNKANLGNDKMNINLDMTSIYGILSRWRGAKTKPIQSQYKANLTQNKPNSNPTCSELVEPIVERPKMNPFAWIRNLTIVLIMLLADFITLKGANCRKAKKGANFKRNDGYFNRSIVIALIIRYSGELITN